MPTSRLSPGSIDPQRVRSNGAGADLRRTRTPRPRRLGLLAVLVLCAAVVGGVVFWSGVLNDWFTSRSPAAEEALQALVALRGITQSGATYQQYAAGFSEAQARVVRALSDQGGSEARQPLQMALNYYAVGLLAWQASLGPREASWVGLAQRLPRDSE